MIYYRVHISSTSLLVNTMNNELPASSRDESPPDQLVRIPLEQENTLRDLDNEKANHDNHSDRYAEEFFRKCNSNYKLLSLTNDLGVARQYKKSLPHQNSTYC